MIVVGGEALVDLVPETSGARGGLPPLVPRLGGGPYNAALAASRLGADIGFLSRISTDTFGAALLSRLRASGVDTELVQRGPEPSTLAVVTLDEHGAADYRFYTAGTADRLVCDPGPLPDSVSAVALGTLGMVLEPGAGAYAAVLRREHERGALTVLDPNIRAELIADPEAYRERFAGWLPYVRLLKLSVEDAAWLADVEPAGVHDAVRAWLGAGVSAVVLTHGADGLEVFTSSGGHASAATSPGRVVDTIGAGDTVQGALLAWAQGRGVRDPAALSAAEWREALRFASAAASITVARAGAEPPTLNELV